MLFDSLQTNEWLTPKIAIKVEGAMKLPLNLLN